MMTPIPLTATERTLALRAANPTMRAVDIAREIGCTRQRVRQILIRAGLPSSSWRPPRICPGCNMKFSWQVKGSLCGGCQFDPAINTARYLAITCDVCGTLIVGTRRDFHMQQREGRQHRGYYCSQECRNIGHVEFMRELGLTKGRLALLALARRRRESPSCPHGHPWTPANTYTTPDGKQRRCRACGRARRHQIMQVIKGKFDKIGQKLLE